MGSEVLCTDGALTVRRFREGDLPELAALLADPEVMRWLEPPFDREKAAEFLRTAELGWVLRRSAWGRGYAGRLTALLLSAAEGKYAQAVIECAPEQRSSARVAGKLGFREDGMADGCRVFRRTVPRDGT